MREWTTSTIQWSLFRQAAEGLWAYLARLTRLPTQPFGTNPHTGLVLT